MAALLTATTAVHGHRDGIYVGDFQLSDQDGETAMITQPTFLATRRGTRTTTAERVLLTVLFTDLVESTPRARQLGDARWRELLREHHALVRRRLELHKGQRSRQPETASW